MCLTDRIAPKSRPFMIAGSLCLALSLGLQSFHLTFGLSPDPLHFVRGFFLGLSIVFNLQAAWLRRCARFQA
jgi:hypothetical protein